jgi:hypothetical protein
MKYACAQLNLWPEAKVKQTHAAGEPRLIIRTCAHMLDCGRLCRQPAAGDRRHCRHHIVLQVRRHKMARAHRRLACLSLPPVLDQHGIEAGLMRIRVVVEAGYLEPADARAVQYALRMVASLAPAVQWEKDMREALQSCRDGTPVAAKSNSNYEVAAGYVRSRGYNINSS